MLPLMNGIGMIVPKMHIKTYQGPLPLYIIPVTFFSNSFMPEQNPCFELLISSFLKISFCLIFHLFQSYGLYLKYGIQSLLDNVGVAFLRLF